MPCKRKVAQYGTVIARHARVLSLLALHAAFPYACRTNADSMQFPTVARAGVCGRVRVRGNESETWLLRFRAANSDRIGAEEHKKKRRFSRPASATGEDREGCH